VGQKVHPFGFRLGFNKTWRSRWYSDRDYAKLLHEDLKLRQSLKKRFAHAGVSKIETERAANNGWSQRTSCQVNSVGPRSLRNVCVVVYQQTSLACPRKLSRFRREFLKNSRGQMLLADLNEGNVGGDSGAYKLENGCELFTRRCCVCVRCALRDQINDWRRQSERHLA